MNLNNIALLSVSLVLAGCSYNVEPVATKALNIYSAYENKVPGRFALLLDGSLRNVKREIAPATQICQAHRYPIVVGDALALSVKHTMESVFEQVSEYETAPSAETLNKLGLSGVILVKLADFAPRLQCARGCWGGTCSANTELSFGVTVRGRSGVLAATSASGSKTSDGESAGACSGGATVIADSITRATRDALERLAERLSNSPKLRESSGLVN